MSDYRKLEVWRKAYALALNAHRVATDIRGAHYASLRSQIIRCAMSIPANIVEGREQRSEAGFARYLRVALGSSSELEHHLGMANAISVVSLEDHTALCAEVIEVRRMLHGLLRRIEPESARRESRDDKSAS
ncbi:MAG TPA: four helix bundle protein [Gemmatimonadaceae bacterium]